MHQFAIRVCGRIENDDKSPSTMSKYQNFNETKRCFDHKKGHCFEFELIAQNTLFDETIDSVLELSLNKRYLFDIKS